jgi:hypothetical protein
MKKVIEIWIWKHREQLLNKTYTWDNWIRLTFLDSFIATKWLPKTKDQQIYWKMSATRMHENHNENLPF